VDLEKLLRKHIAWAFIVNVRTITRWVKEGFPRNEDGSYHLQKCIQWVIDRVEEKSGTSNQDSEESLHWLGQYRKEKAIMARLRRETLEGDLMSKTEIIDQWTKRVIITKLGLLAFKDRLPAMLEGKTRKQISRIVEFEVLELLKSYTAPGKYTPRVEFSQDGEILKVKIGSDES
jgi:hypothetical protein